MPHPQRRARRMRHSFRVLPRPAEPEGGQLPEGGCSIGGSLTVSTGVMSVTVGVAVWLPFVRASSLGDCTGGRVDGVRRVEPVQAGRGGRLTIGLKISAICSLF